MSPSSPVLILERRLHSQSSSCALQLNCACMAWSQTGGLMYFMLARVAMSNSELVLGACCGSWRWSYDNHGYFAVVDMSRYVGKYGDRYMTFRQLSAKQGSAHVSQYHWSMLAGSIPFFAVFRASV